MNQFCSLTIALAACAALGQLTAVETGFGPRGKASTGVFPAKGLPTEFWDVPEGFNMNRIIGGKAGKMNAQRLPRKDLKAGDRKNVLWRATLPHWGNNTPLVVGDKVFVMTEPGWKHDAPQLVCLAVKDGAILWQHDVDHLDGLPSGERKTAKKARAKELQRFRDYMKVWNGIYWNNDKNTWARPDEATYEQKRQEAEKLGWKFKVGQHKWPESGNNSTRGRMGLSYNNGKQGGVPADHSLVKNYEVVRDNAWHLYQGWTTEKCWYGTVHGSLVTDGENIYAVTMLGAATAFTPEGKLLWVTNFNRYERLRKRTTGNVSSPVIADDALIYYHRDAAQFLAFDVKTGKIRWAVKSPLTPSEHRDYKGFGGQPKHHGGHMGPGSSPVILELGETPVAVSGNGMVVRIDDGKLLGVIESQCGSVYWEWTGSGDVFYSAAGGKERKLQAVRFGIDGDQLTQEVLWTSANPAPHWEWASGLILDGDKLYVPGIGGKRSGMCIVDAKTGKVLKQGGSTNSNYGTTFAVSDQHYVVRKTKWDTKGWAAFEIVDRLSLKTVGKGLLCQERSTGEIKDRHISFLGWPELEFGVTASSAWGNKLFIRSNDYLWCIGK